eukprot:286289-Rhodomonas_salina.3
MPGTDMLYDATDNNRFDAVPPMIRYLTGIKVATPLWSLYNPRLYTVIKRCVWLCDARYCHGENRRFRDVMPGTDTAKTGVIDER